MKRLLIQYKMLTQKSSLSCVPTTYLHVEFCNLISVARSIDINEISELVNLKFHSIFWLNNCWKNERFTKWKFSCICKLHVFMNPEQLVVQGNHKFLPGRIWQSVVRHCSQSSHLTFAIIGLFFFMQSELLASDIISCTGWLATRPVYRMNVDHDALRQSILKPTNIALIVPSRVGSGWVIWYPNTRT